MTPDNSGYKLELYAVREVNPVNSEKINWFLDAYSRLTLQRSESETMKFVFSLQKTLL